MGSYTLPSGGKYLPTLRLLPIQAQVYMGLGPSLSSSRLVAERRRDAEMTLMLYCAGELTRDPNNMHGYVTFTCYYCIWIYQKILLKNAPMG